MRDKLIGLRDDKLLDLLAIKKINYLSLTVFNYDKPIISYCNHPLWFSYYKNEYNVNKPPPVQKYILSSTLDILHWDCLGLDSQTRQFIKKRNDVVGVKANISVLYQKNKKLAALTFGSKMRETHLINFLAKDIKCLSYIINNVFYLIN